MSIKPVLYRVIKVLLLFFVCVFFVHSISIVVWGHSDNIQKSDVILVLGNEVKHNGTPSTRLASRLDAAIEVYKGGYAPVVIVSGGLGKSGYEEADVMKDYLVENGVYPHHIVKDYNGVNTQRSVLFTQGFLEDTDTKAVIIVSNYYHIPRTYLYMNKLGIEEIHHAHAQHYELRNIYSIFREVIAIYYYQILL